jgi:hypothetical protein
MSSRALLLTITCVIILSFLWPFNIGPDRYMPDLPIVQQGFPGGGDGVSDMWTAEKNTTRELDTDVNTAYLEVKKELEGKGWIESSVTIPVLTWEHLPGPQRQLGVNHGFSKRYMGVHMGVLVGPSLNRQSSQARVYRYVKVNYIRPIWTNFAR